MQGKHCRWILSVSLRFNVGDAFIWDHRFEWFGRAFRLVAVVAWSLVFVLFMPFGCTLESCVCRLYCNLFSCFYLDTFVYTHCISVAVMWDSFSCFICKCVMDNWCIHGHVNNGSWLWLNGPWILFGLMGLFCHPTSNNHPKLIVFNYIN